MVGAPLVAVATLAAGLRVGAGEAVRGVVVFTAPPGKIDPKGTARTAFQLLTVLDDRGVRETVPMRGLRLEARDARGESATWEGASNLDGVAEATLAWNGKPVAPVHVVVRHADDPLPLAEGDVGWAPFPPQGDARAARPTRREGELAVDVLVLGERLVPGFATDVWLRISGPGSAVTVALDPEPGLQTSGTRACPATSAGTRWVQFSAVALGHVTALTLKATSGEHEGSWAGQLPVAPGAFFVSLPNAAPPGVEGGSVTLVAPNPRTVVYAEIDDEEGRVFAAALPLATEPGDPIPRAKLQVPALAEGMHWLVVSGEPHGAEKLDGATVARPFLVTPRATAEDPLAKEDACAEGPNVVTHPARGFPRTPALDGLPARSAKNRARRAAGLGIAFAALFTAALVDALLLAQIAREARARLAAATGDAAEAVAPRPGTTLAITLLLVVLGFLLLAALIVAHG